MGRVVVNITASLDGFVAGPSPTLEEPLGKNGEWLHEWVTATDSWREQHGLEGGESNSDSEIVKESVEAAGAYVMGRKMFSGGSGPWEDDPRSTGWWGDEPPFHVPVFVLTHHERPSEVKGDSPITFVTDGVDAALERAREAAGEKDVYIAGGANVAQQFLAAGHLDELNIHVAPVLLGGGTPLFAEGDAPKLELVRTVASPAVTHLRYHVLK
jgi:dihydrofolate reductase